MLDKTTVIINPMAGQGKTKLSISTIQQQLADKTGGSCEVIQTQGPNHATAVASEAVIKDSTLVIVAGGDGTINEVINGILSSSDRTQRTCEVGILNSGSGADFSRTLGLPKNIDQQLEVILNKPGRLVDVGLLQCLNGSGETIHRYFINECQIGIGGTVVAQMGTSKKRLGGTLDFGLAALKQLFLYEACKMQVSIDGEIDQSGNMLGVVFANGVYSAGGMKMAPEANINDGLLDILCMSQMNLLDRMITFGKVYFGNHVNSRYAMYRKGKSFVVESKRALWVEADGELIGRTPCSISIIPNAIRLRY